MMSTKNNQFAVNDIVLCLFCFSLIHGCLRRVSILRFYMKWYLFLQLGHILNAEKNKIFQHFFIIHMLSQIARIKDINVVCSSIKDLLYLLHNHVYIVSLKLKNKGCDRQMNNTHNLVIITTNRCIRQNIVTTQH